MNSPKKLLFNTIITYIRIILSTGFGLFSSRWILDALGSSNYGLFSLVGGVIVFITLINGLLGSSATRFFAIAQGHDDLEECRQWFNISLAIHSLIPLLLLGGLAPIGELLIKNVFKIAPAMIPNAVWIFRISLIAAWFNMVSIPYVSMFSAKQHFGELSFWGMLQTIVK